MTARRISSRISPGTHVYYETSDGERHRLTIVTGRTRDMLWEGVGRLSGRHREPHVLAEFEDGSRRWEPLADLKLTSRDRARPSPRRATTRPFVKKAGKHGTLYLFRIGYRDNDDPASPDFVERTWAYDAEHATDKFYDAPDADGWRITSVDKVRQP